MFLLLLLVFTMSALLLTLRSRVIAIAEIVVAALFAIAAIDWLAYLGDKSAHIVGEFGQPTTVSITAYAPWIFVILSAVQVGVASVLLRRR
jgi:archaellin